MARERLEEKQHRAARMYELLDAAMPQAKIELDWSTPLELLVAVLLSAQTTDKRVNLVTPALFARCKTASDYAQTPVNELEAFIQTVGLFRTKAKNLSKLGAALLEHHGGVVPTSRDVLAELPGVGLKTAGVVSMHLGGTRAFPVDTHILRLSKRLGLSTSDDPDDVEADMQKVFPEDRWFQGHQLLIWHGRRVCHAQRPECHRCVIAPHCPKRGVKQPKAK